MPAGGAIQGSDARVRAGVRQEIPFDFYLDGWDPAAASFQESGDLILVPLPHGFYGAIVGRVDGLASHAAGVAALA